MPDVSTLAHFEILELIMRNKKRILGPAFSSYAGRVHIPNITVKPAIFPNHKIYINTVCGGHVIVDESDMFSPKREKSLKNEEVSQ